MKLSDDEMLMYDGKRGEVWQKVIRSVVQYGEIFEAERLVPLQGRPHLVLSVGARTLRPTFSMLEKLVDCGITSFEHFTVNPRPVDYKNISYSLPERLLNMFIFSDQQRYENLLDRFGLSSRSSFSCACYLEELNNVPAFGSNLAWSESSAVVYANSCLGARSNRNSGGIDFLCNALGKAPLFGLLKDENRSADYVIELDADKLPDAQMLGGAIGKVVVDKVPYIINLDRHLVDMGHPDVLDYLKDLGAAAASSGSVGLFHVENVTPEAQRFGRDLVRSDAKRLVVSDEFLDEVYNGYRSASKEKKRRPAQCILGCPHFSLRQARCWLERISESLALANRRKAAMDVILCASPGIGKHFSENERTKLRHSRIHLTSICPLAHMNNPITSRRMVITNSNKLRTYTSAFYYRDDELLQRIIHG